MALALLVHFAGCAFFCIRVRNANAPKNSHPLRALIALSSRPVPILFPPCTPFFPISFARAVCTVFRFGRETMKSLSPMAIATNADRISRNRRPFLFPLLSLYINIYIFFFFGLFGLHRSIRGFYRKRGTFDRDVLTATTRAPTRQNFPRFSTNAIDNHSGSFLTLKIISPEICPCSNVR